MRPSMITGTTTGLAVNGESMRLALAVNGRIQALTRTFDNNLGKAQFMAMIPESTLVQGQNTIDVFRILGRGKYVRLQSPSR